MITWQCFEASLLPFVRADQQPPHYRPQKDDDNIDHNVQETANILSNPSLPGKANILKLGDFSYIAK